ncbi:hypothetical protein FHL15_004932 [Xylaria flabelliformis]|uniref:Uncharacterized protein n=1 Tax=Xylaria flabelliformis TaxID=2512241 RepID=A0A553I1U0_9PEZI|nr:hypothetical protein FHL15_004932 [Xylaria flabelliformis]
MASAADTPEVATTDMATPKVNIPEVVNFLSLLSTLVADPSTTWVKEVLKENEDMKAAVKQKEAESNGFVQAITKVSNDFNIEVEKSKQAIAQSNEAKTKAGELVTEIEDAKKTIADRDQKLQEDATTITNLQGNVETLDKEVKARDEIIKKQEEQQANNGARIKELEGSLETTQSELDVKTSQLRELRDLSCEVVEGTKDFVIYGYAKGLAVLYFGEDLPEEILANTALFDEIRRLVRPIPFPNSNSAAAKKARIAAFLASLGSRLADLIFLPYYIEPDDEEAEQHGLDAITVLLSNLSHNDPKRELHLRSVLLAISPDEQKKIACERVEMITNEVFELLGILLSADLQPKFEQDVRKLCQLAVQSWNTLRPLKEKVEPFTQTEEDSEKYWLPAELDSGSQTKKQVNGKPNGLVSKPSLHSLKSANKVILVWPGFSYGSEVLKQGFMLLDSQVKSAEDESQPLKRERRAMQRAATSSPVHGRRSVARKSKMFPRSD